GCSCTPKPTDCTADVWYYPLAADCTNDTTLTGGVYAGNFGFMCSGNPVNSGSLNFNGARVSSFKVIQSCTAAGTAAAPSAGWDPPLKFCRADGVGKGCGAGH